MRKTLAEFPYTIEISLLLFIHAVMLQIQFDCNNIEGVQVCVTRNPMLAMLQTRFGFEPLISAILVGAVLLGFSAYALALHLRREERESKRAMYLVLLPVIVIYGWTVLVIAQPPLGPLTTLVLAVDALRLHYKTISMQGQMRSQARIIDHLNMLANGDSDAE